MKRFRLGMSCRCTQDLTEQDFYNYAKAGVKELELSFTWERYPYLDYAGIRRKAKQTGVHLWSFHLPFFPFKELNIASTNSDIRAYSLGYLNELMGKAADIGVKIMVIHPSGEPVRKEEREECMKCSGESLAYLAETAERLGAVMAVEDLPRSCLGRNSAELKQLLAADDRLRVCFDTNHLLGQPIKEFILDVGDKIITTHCSDYDFVDERHWMPGEGLIDWKELLDTLESVGYNGPLLYEMDFTPPKEFDRKLLTCMDFKENHYLLLNRRI